ITLRAAGGSQLSFFLAGRTLHHIDFVVEVQNEWLTAASPAAATLNSSPALFFQNIASQFSGWRSLEGWGDAEGRVRFLASPSANGGVKLEVVLNGPKFTDQAQITLIFEAAALGDISREVSSLFE